MIRILHSVSNMDRAGIETMLMNFYRHIDREAVQFDFLANKPKPGDYDDEIRAMGGRIFISPGYKRVPQYFRYMRALFSEHPEYKIIHAHNGSLMLYAMRSAQMNHIPVRIAHAHATSIPFDFKNGVKQCMKPLIKYTATDYWGCSNAAGEFYFTKKRWDARHELIHNAIDVSRFSFREEYRKEIRARYGLGDKFVVGHVGRLTWQKNQKKLLEVFAALRRMRPDAVLLIVGTGELADKLKAQSAALGIADAVIFAGVQSDVYAWYSAFDTFVMTSWYEGLPVVGIEAQAADLPCVFSDEITPEVKVTDRVRFMGLNDPAEAWAQAVLSFAPAARVGRFDELCAAGYDIETEAKRMQALYTELYANIKNGDQR
ncbi:MAG: glycosyltransferase family 1 protein [Clostridia bacterium]|nr:glycosyltransferase family 1 protein [Clostridia bacterium]